MRNLSNRIDKLESATPDFDVQIGCKTIVGNDRAEHILGEHRRETKRQPGEPQKSFLGRAREAAALFNREMFPTATIILEADAEEL